MCYLHVSSWVFLGIHTHSTRRFHLHSWNDLVISTIRARGKHDTVNKQSSFNDVYCEHGECVYTTVTEDNC